MAEEKKSVVEILGGESISLIQEQEGQNSVRETIDVLKRELGHQYVMGGTPEFTFYTGDKDHPQSPVPSVLVMRVQMDQYSNYYVCPADPYLLLSLAQKILDNFDPLKRTS